MKYIFDPEEEDVDPRRRSGAMGRDADADREITLGTRSLLGIFFGLVLICGIFFGLGYSVGRGSAPHAADLADVPATVGQRSSPAAKPSAQESLTAVPPAAAPQENAGDENTPATAPQPGTAPGTQTKANEPEAGGTPRAASEAGTPPKPAMAASPPAGAPPSKPAATSEPSARPTAAFVPTAGSAPKPLAAVPAAQSQGTATQPTSFMVQVAAVSVPQNAEVLIGALEKRGFHATARREPQDTLLHVELGPFTTRAEANYTRSRLLADGYNGVVK
jgi:cell division protein FtsN